MRHLCNKVTLFFCLIFFFTSCASDNIDNDPAFKELLSNPWRIVQEKSDNNQKEKALYFREDKKLVLVNIFEDQGIRWNLKDNELILWIDNLSTRMVTPYHYKIKKFAGDVVSLKAVKGKPVWNDFRSLELKQDVFNPKDLIRDKTWTLETIDFFSTIPDESTLEESIYLHFHNNELVKPSLTGYAGANNLQGEYSLKEQMGNNLMIKNLTTKKSLSPGLNNKFETTFLMNLANANYYIIWNNDLYLYLDSTPFAKFVVKDSSHLKANEVI